MARRGENIYKRKDGRWEGRYIDHYNANGKPVYRSVYAASYMLVKEKMQNQDRNLKVYNALSTSFGKIGSDWLDTVRSTNKESTYMKYKNICVKHLFPMVDKYPISKISTEQVESFVLDKLSNGNLSVKTVSDILSVAKQIFLYAKKHGQSIICDFNAIRIKHSDNEMRVLNCDEQRLLTAYLLTNSDLKGLGILICLYTGIRIGELCALKWNNISLEKKTLYVNKTLQRIQDSSNTSKKTKIIITAPKSKCSVREIPLPNFLTEILEQYECDGENYILTGSKDKYIEPRSMQNFFKSCLKKCDIDDATFHCLRHTFATRSVESGFEIKTLSEILGHSSVNITLDRYVHSSMNLKRMNMEKVKLYR